MDLSFWQALNFGHLNWNGLKTQDGEGLILSEGEVRFSGDGQAIIILQKKIARLNFRHYR